MKTEPQSIELIIGLKYERSSYKPTEDRRTKWEKHKAYAVQLFQKAKEIFAAKYPEISIVNEIMISYALLATGKKGDMQRIWNVAFMYETFTVNNINGESQQISDWRMHGTVVIPKDLEDIVQSVSLNQKIVLDD